jgi:hypothetical protein
MFGGNNSAVAVRAAYGHPPSQGDNGSSERGGSEYPGWKGFEAKDMSTCPRKNLEA